MPGGFWLCFGCLPGLGIQSSVQMTKICVPSFDSGKKRLLRMGLPLLRWTLACLFLSQLHCTRACAQSTSTEARFREATEALRAGHLDEAADKFATITKDSPGFAEAHLDLGLIREEQGRNEEAIASLQKALTLKPRLRGANLFLAIAEYRLNHFDKSISALQKETSYYPSDANAWMWLGVVQLAAENPEDAVAALDKAAKLAPDNVDILYHRGRAHLLVSKNSYEKMFKVDPHSWRVHQVLGQMAAEAERHEDAIAQYLAAIKLAPTQPGLHEELAGEYHAAARIPEAEAAYRQELEIDPHNVNARYKLGILFVEIHEPAKGKELIDAALREKPGLADSDYHLGRA